MSGPPYPRGPFAGSNAIGSFIIGVSPIGSLSAFDFWDTVISQYANSPSLTSMIESFNDCLDQTANFDTFYDLIWNVATAQGYGLDVWGRIVGVTRVLQVADGGFFGFEGGSGASGSPFNVAPFYNGSALTSNFSLTDDAFRVLIFAKALSNISDGSIPSINNLLLNLFPGRGNAYVTDGLDMTMTYTFDFPLSAVDQAIVQSSGVLPKPVGVAATAVFP